MQNGSVDRAAHTSAAKQPSPSTQAVESVLDALRGEILQSVQSAQAKTSLLSAIRLLGRVHDELAAADDPPLSRLRPFAALRDELETLLAHATVDAAQRSARVEIANRPERSQEYAASIQLLLRSASAPQMAGAPFDAWLRRTAQAYAEFFEGRETSLLLLTRASEPTTDDASGPLRLELCGYLAERFPRLGPASVRKLHILPGGYAKQTALIELNPNPELPTRLVLRRDSPRGGSTGTTVANEFPLLAQMHSAGLPVPKPLFFEADPTRIGGGFVVMEEVVGAARAGEIFPELNSGTFYHEDFPFELARVLAALHRMKTLPPSFKPTGFVAHGEDAIANVEGFRDLWRGLSNAPLAPLVDAGYAWLLANPLPAGRGRTVVHADVGAHNILLRDGHLAALLDWELAHIGDPAEDLAYVRTLLIQPLVPWTRFVDAYLAAGGSQEACDPRAVNWFSVWNHVRNCSFTAILYARAREGTVRDVNSVAAGWDYSARLQRYLAMDLGRALTQGANR